MTSEEIERALSSIAEVLIAPTINQAESIRISFDLPGATVTFVLEKDGDKFNLR